MVTSDDICPLCDRPIGSFKSKHHLVPKTFGGKETEYLHKICHDKIHSTFDNRELKNIYNTIEKVRAHEEIQKFIKWVSKKEPDFYDKQIHTSNRRSKFKYIKG